MAKKKAPAKPTLKDCKKCNESIEIENLLYCKMRIKSINNPTSIGIVSFIDERGYFRLKKEI